MAHTPARPLTAAEQALAPPVLQTMRESALRALGPDDAPDAPPLSAAIVNTLALALRGHLEVLVPEVERAAGPRPKSIPSYCALACAGEARRKLGVTPGTDLEAQLAHARRLARSLNAIADHYEQLGAGAS